MTQAEVRSVVVDLIGRVRLDGGAGPVVAEVAGVHRTGTVADGAGRARWYETVLEWHARSP